MPAGEIEQQFGNFDRRYRDVATALSVAQTRRMSSEPSEAPDIQPNPTVQRAEGATFEDDALSDLSNEDVHDHIMDYRFGLGKNVT